MWRLEVPGKPPSLNKFYAGVHWTARKKAADEWHSIFYYALKGLKGLPKKLSGPVTVNVTQFCKGRPRDADNTVVACKFFLDALKMGKWIEDDDYTVIPSVTLNTRKGKEDKIVIIFG